MDRDIFEDAVEWQPLVSPERRNKIAKHRDHFAASATIFKRVRTALGLSQVEAAARLGTTQANISKIEKRSGADVAQLEKLAANTDYEVVVLLRRKDSRDEFVLSTY